MSDIQKPFWLIRGISMFQVNIVGWISTGNKICTKEKDQSEKFWPFSVEGIP